MKDFRNLIRRYKELGGWRLFVAYIRMGTLWPDTKVLLHCIKEEREFKTAYPEMIGTVEAILAKKYGYILDEAFKDYSFDVVDTTTVPKIVWACWLQGMENAPVMVKCCIG